MKRFCCWMLLVLGVPLAARAQAAFRPGYVVSLAGDTLRGTVAEGGERSKLEYRFKASPTASASKYLPAQLRGYGFLNDRFYQSQRVPVAASPAGPATQRLFLEVLVQGPATLFYLSDGRLGDRYFLRSGSGPVRPLVLQSNLVVENGSRFKQSQALYRGTLAEAFQGCPAVQGRVGTVAYKGSFVDVVRDYNTCVGGAQQVAAVAASNRRSYLRLEAVAGGQLSSLRFNTASASPLASALPSPASRCC